MLMQSFIVEDAAMLRGMIRTPGHEIADQPHVDDFAK